MRVIIEKKLKFGGFERQTIRNVKSVVSDSKFIEIELEDEDENGYIWHSYRLKKGINWYFIQ